MKTEKTSSFRKLAIYGFEAIHNGHNFYALLDFDITSLRSALRKKRGEGSGGSLFSFMLKAIGKSLEDFPEMNSMVNLKKTTLFDSVDIGIPIEFEEGGKKYTKQYIIRDINSKKISQVDGEIELSRRERNPEKGFVGSKKLFQFLSILPRWIVKLLFKTALLNHKKVQEMSGTVFVTSVSMFSNVPGYIIPYSGGPKLVSFAIGSSVQKPVVKNKEIVIREMLNVTAVFNHDGVDGAQAARFINGLRQYIERDYIQLIA